MGASWGAGNDGARVMMRLIYNILFLGFFCVSAPYYFWKMWRRGNWQAGFGQRFACYDAAFRAAVAGRRMVWLHAVSVGEVNVCVQLIRALEPRLPGVTLVVSTTTSTGMGELQKKLPEQVLKMYYPIDRRGGVRRALELIRPEAVVLVEAEIWPNFLWELRERRVPLFLVNARLSERSYRGYRRFGFLFAPLFAGFRGVGAQNELDAGRLRELGFRPGAVRVVGNLKFDAAAGDGRRGLDARALLRQVGVPEDSLVVVAGSTHAGEEVILAEQCRRLRGRFPSLFLVLVPRHFERAKSVMEELVGRGITLVRRSELQPGTRLERGAVECLLVDTTGELKYFYECAAVVFVGKSLTAEGGQSPIEPGALGRAMVFGPNMQNFAAIAAAFVAEGGAVQVRDAAELERELGELLADAGRRAALGRAARAVVERNLGAVERTVEMIVEGVSGKDGG